MKVLSSLAQISDIKDFRLRELMHQLGMDPKQPAIFYRELIKEAREVIKELEEKDKKLAVKEKEVGLVSFESISSKVKELEKEIESLKVSLSDIDGIKEKILSLERGFEWIIRSANRRLREDIMPCEHLNREGYCQSWFWKSKVEEWDMKEGYEEGKKVWYLNVKKYPLICISCPTYKPKES